MESPKQLHMKNKIRGVSDNVFGSAQAEIDSQSSPISASKTFGARSFQRSSQNDNNLRSSFSTLQDERKNNNSQSRMAPVKGTAKRQSPNPASRAGRNLTALERSSQASARSRTPQVVLTSFGGFEDEDD